jgi:transcriptional regulator with AAA-type ATPase domain
VKIKCGGDITENVRLTLEHKGLVCVMPNEMNVLIKGEKGVVKNPIAGVVNHSS